MTSNQGGARLKTDTPINPYFANISENPEYAVRKMLAQVEWEGEVPVDLIGLCDMYDYPYIFEERPSMREEGTTEVYEGQNRIVINTAGQVPTDDFSEDDTQRRRQRFTLAHEIGHCALRSHTDTDLQQSLDEKNNPHRTSYQKQKENQANSFAANLLIPTEHFRQFLKGKSLKDLKALVQEISDTYDVSIEMAVQRLAAAVRFPCITIVFQDGKAKRVPAFSAAFQETGLFFAKGDPIPTSTSAHRLHLGKTDTDFEQTNYRTAGTWFPGKPWLVEKFKVYERSFTMGSGRVITVLEIEEIEVEW
jgi:hypothetical protein